MEAHVPPRGTPASRFHRWILIRESRIQEMLESLTTRWRLFGVFVEINFLHPRVGPAGALILTSSIADTTAMRRRVQRLRVIPFRELDEYIPRWESGETVEVSVDHMPEDLARRYATTPIRWSLNVPILVEETWVGMVGAVTERTGFDRRTVAGFEAMAEVLMLDFAADAAWCGFRRLTAPGKRFLQSLR